MQNHNLSKNVHLEKKNPFDSSADHGCLRRCLSNVYADYLPLTFESENNSGHIDRITMETGACRITVST
jgi:hypothetical protein